MRPKLRSTSTPTSTIERATQSGELRLAFQIRIGPVLRDFELKNKRPASCEHRNRVQTISKSRSKKRGEEDGTER